ncbi:MAG: ABC transporter substrate-binding protein [Prevotella sp.]|nr:ABC transporter substrate-binding protein [Prevotella sp.]
MSKQLVVFITCIVLLSSCGGGRQASTRDEGDTVHLRYAKNLTIVRHDGYTEVSLKDPWNQGKTLHRYILAPREAPQEAPKAPKAPHSAPEGATNASALGTNEAPSGAVGGASGASGATVIHVPLQRVVVGTSVLCGLIDKLGRRDAIRGVCDVQYVNIPFVQEGCRKGTIADCGSGLAPTLEKIIDLQPDGICLSPFQNSGGYGRIEELDVPIIEMADYMETSALGRAEWVRFYGMLLGVEEQADSLFNAVEQDYLRLKQLAAKAPHSAPGKAPHSAPEGATNASALGTNEAPSGAVGGASGASATSPSILMDKQTGSVWYVPAGQSTIGGIIRDANIRYAWADNGEGGSLPLPFETILEKAGQADIWLFRYNAPQPVSYASLLSENAAYSQFRAFQQHHCYGCNTATTTFYEDTPFHPNLLLRDFICIAHPELGLGEPKYFLPVAF